MEDGKLLRMCWNCSGRRMRRPCCSASPPGPSLGWRNPPMSQTFHSPRPHPPSRTQSNRKRHRIRNRTGTGRFLIKAALPLQTGTFQRRGTKGRQGCRPLRMRCRTRCGQADVPQLPLRRLCKKELSLRTSAHTGVAIPLFFQTSPYHRCGNPTFFSDFPTFSCLFPSFPLYCSHTRRREGFCGEICCDRYGNQLG